MDVLGVMDVSVVSLPSREAWIEITWTKAGMLHRCCRFPRGKGGLKFLRDYGAVHRPGSLPSREAWIGIAPYMPTAVSALVASPTGSVD